MLFNFPHFHFHFFFGPSFCGRKELTAFPANSSVTIYLPASCCFLFALSDTFHYGRGPLTPQLRPLNPYAGQRQRQRLLLCIVHAIIAS